MARCCLAVESLRKRGCAVDLPLKVRQCLPKWPCSGLKPCLIEDERKRGNNRRRFTPNAANPAVPISRRGVARGGQDSYLSCGYVSCAARRACRSYCLC